MVRNDALLLLHLLYRHGEEQGRFKTKKYDHLDKCPTPAASGYKKIITITELQINIIHTVDQKKEKKKL